MRTHHYFFFLFFFLSVSKLVAQQTGISLSGINIAYVEVYNPVDIIPGRINPKKLVTKTSENLELFTTDSGDYAVPHARGTGYIYIGKRRLFDTLWVDTFSLRLKVIPTPKVSLGGLPLGMQSYPKAPIVDQLGYGLTLDPGPIGPTGRFYKMLSFKLAVVGKDIRVYECQGSKLSDEAKTAVLQMKPGTHLYFCDLEYVKLPTNDTSTLLPFTFTCKPTSDNYKKWFQFSFLTADASLQSGRNVELDPTSEFPKVIDFMDSVESGIVNMYYLAANRLHRFELIYSYSEIIAEHAYDALGNRIYTRTRLNSDLWYFSEFYPSGELRTQCTVSDSMIYYGSNHYHRFQQYPYNYFGDSNFLTEHEEYPVHRLHYVYGLVPLGNFTAYSENGNMACRGRLDKEPNTLTTLMVGEWEFVNADGSIVKKTYSVDNIKPGND